MKQNFQEWFNESRVVDGDDNPLVVFHGTYKSFDEFSVSNGEHSIFGRGAYFTSSAEDASRYASKDPSVNFDIPGKAEFLASQLDIPYREAREVVLSGNEQVIPVFLSMQNPLEIGGKSEPICALKKHYEYALKVTKKENLEIDVKYLMALDEIDASSEDSLRKSAYEAGESYGLRRYERLIELVEKSNYSITEAQYKILGGDGLREMMISLNKDGIIHHQVENKYNWVEENTKHYFIRDKSQILSKFDPIVTDMLQHEKQKNILNGFNKRCDVGKQSTMEAFS